MVRVIAAALAVVTTLLMAPASSDAGKKDKADLVGVITALHRDGDAKEKVLGFIVVNDAKIKVMKATEILRAGKSVPFKALDKGDKVAIYVKEGHPHIADKITIRKD